MNGIRPTANVLVVVFTVITCAVSWSFLWAVRSGMPVAAWAFPFVLMWIPGTVAIGMRLTFREGFADAGFRVGTLRYWAAAYLVPLAIATLTYAAAWTAGAVHITPYLKQQSMFGPWPFRMAWWNAEAGTTGLLVQRFAVVATWGIAIGFPAGLGEEIGWRGYLLPRLVQARSRFPILISGSIWAAWHVPFVLLTYTQEPFVTAALYALLCIVVAVFISWLRLRSGSVLVAGMAHGAYNTFYQNFYDHSFAGPHKWFWAGEIGLLCSVFFGGLALWLYRTDRMGSAGMRLDPR